jgi:secreted trypsin-like serine protease
MRILLFLCLALPAFGAHVQQHIVGGIGAFIGSYPFQLSLREDGVHTCGASLISTTRALTSAQCAGSAIGVYSLLGGTSDRTDTNCPTCVLRNLNLISINPFYEPNGGFPFDFAVLGFTDVTFNDNFNAVILATNEGGDFAGAGCTITGWGETRFGGGLEDTLVRADVTVMTNTDCEGTHGQGAIAASHICAFGGDGSACTGDRGGPLVCGGDTLAGVISWWEDTCSSSYPTVSARVSVAYLWIVAQ